jgi:hypothetical protein
VSQQIQTFAITAPGFQGVNTDASPLDLSSGWALVANNCVIDQFGRIGARKGWTPEHVTLAALGSAPVEAIGELVVASGATYTVAAGNNKLFKLASGVLSELTYGGGGVAPVITASNWCMASLNGCLYLYQAGHDPLVFDPAVSTTQYRRVSEKTGYSGTVQQANIVISAYGRTWSASTTTDKVTIQFSDLLNGHKLTAGTAGTLDLTTVWPRGGDSITGLAAHNGFLVIFGRNCILVYQGATTPSTMSLSDVVVGVGCCARDSVQNTGSDVIFLSDTGVRSLTRTIQEKSAPMRDLSKNVKNDLVTAVAGETLSSIKSVYSPSDAFYLLSLPVLKQVYCFDMKGYLQDGSARVTTWDSMEPTSFCALQDRTILIGKQGYIASYEGYQDNTASYRLQYYTNHTDFGAPQVTSVLKKINVMVIGASDQTVALKWSYDFSGNYRSQLVAVEAAETGYYGEAEYGESYYSTGVNIETLGAYPTGSGKVVQMGFEADINGGALSIQKIEVHAKQGKVG